MKKSRPPIRPHGRPIHFIDAPFDRARDGSRFDVGAHVPDMERLVARSPAHERDVDPHERHLELHAPDMGVVFEVMGVHSIE